MEGSQGTEWSSSPPPLAVRPQLSPGCCDTHTGCFFKRNYVLSGNTGLSHYISFKCTTLYFYFYILYSVLTPKILVSIPHHTLAALYPPCPPNPFPSGNHYSVLCIYVSVLVWFVLFIYFVLFLSLFVFGFLVWFVFGLVFSGAENNVADA